MESQHETIHFKDDDELIDFVLSSVPTVIAQDIEGRTIYAYDYDYTPQYLDAVARGIMLEIDDPESKVRKRNAVYRGMITKPVENIVGAWDD